VVLCEKSFVNIVRLLFWCRIESMTLVFDEDKQQKRVEELYKEEAEQLAQVLSQKYGLPYIDLSRFSINTDALKIVLEPRAREAGFAPFEIKGRKVDAAVITPESPKLLELLDELRMSGYILTLYMASKMSLERVWERYKELSLSTGAEAGLIEISEEHLTTYLQKLHHIFDVSKEIDEVIATGKAHGASKILELVLAGAISTDSSDIHFEPEESQTRLRFRLDGVLNDVAKFKLDAYKLILSRIKLISGLKLNLREASQDGRFSIKLGEDQIEIRTSVIPGAYGESIVLRILNPK